jgi:hypothetical protein
MAFLLGINDVRILMQGISAIATGIAVGKELR